MGTDISTTSDGLANGKMSKTLLIFDFDHTIIADNTDVEVRALSKIGIPKEIQDIYVESKKNGRCWTDFMQAVFECLHKQGVGEQDYARCMSRLTFTPGMERLLRMIGQQNNRYETVIVSDSNTFFIDTILKHNNLTSSIAKVFTNPAHFDDKGCLRIRYFHNQAECDLSEKNMCKGRIVKEYLEERKIQGQIFDRLAYVGDGQNDYCPVFRNLGTDDLAFVRKGFALEKLVKENEKKLKCKLHFWSTADEIAEVLGVAQTKI